jgi:predicted permease
MNPIVGKVLTFFILIGVGFTIKKVRLVDDSFTKGLSSFVLYVTLPALVIDSMQFQFSFEMLSSSLILLLSGGFLYAFLWIVGLIIVKLLKLEGKARAVVLYASLLGNVAYMGYPVVEMVLGREGVFYTGVFNIWFNILTWTAGVRIIAGKESGNRKKCFLNPGIISLLIGLFLFVFSIPLPGFLEEPLNLLGECTVPLAMVVAGITLAGANIKSVLGDQRVIVYSLFKLLAVPLTVFLFLQLVELPDVVEKILIIMSAMPAAANTSIFARIYDSDYYLASRLIAASTFFSLVSIPVIISLFD